MNKNTGTVPDDSVNCQFTFGFVKAILSRVIFEGRDSLW